MKDIKKLFGIAFACSPILFIINIVIFIYMGLSIGLQTWAVQRLFDALSDTMNSIQKDYSQPIFFCFLVGGLLVLEQIVNTCMNVSIGSYAEKLAGFLKYRLQKVLNGFSLIQFEDPNTLDNIRKAENGCGNVFGLIYVISSLIFMYVPYFIFMSCYLYSLNPLLLFLMCFILIPLSINQIVKSKLFGKLENDSVPMKRKMEQYERYLYDKEFFKETRTLGAYDFFSNLYRDTVKNFIDKRWKTEKFAGFVELGSKILVLSGYIGIIILTTVLTLNGVISIGAFAAIITSIDSMFALMNEIITIHIGGMAREFATVKNLVLLLADIKENNKNEDVDFKKGIDSDHVNFTYPGRVDPALENITIHIPENQIVAIVGENGAGKSTLCKLLTGLYQPDEGNIKIGGADSRDFLKSNLHSGISAVFQKYIKYSMTIADNISISDIEKETDIEKIKNILNDIEIGDNFLAAAGSNLESMLGREFDGMEPSLGQWQRLAIARGLYRVHNIIILDEPTAAIDPIEESKLYHLFLKLAKGKTAFIVTHRLGAVRFADRILVLDHGTMVEDGSHEELLQNGGKYANMFQQQAKWYI